MQPGYSQIPKIAQCATLLPPSPQPPQDGPTLEEAGLPYEVIPVDTRKGEQHLPHSVDTDRFMVAGGIQVPFTPSTEAPSTSRHVGGAKKLGVPSHFSDNR
jgi:hypothetical protein